MVGIEGKIMGNISHKSQEKKIMEVVNIYRKYVCDLIQNGNHENQVDILFDNNGNYKKYWNQVNGRSLSKEERYVCRINFILSSLDRNEALIIWNEFFFPDNKYAWTGKYNRSTFYRIRARAIENFSRLI